VAASPSLVLGVTVAPPVPADSAVAVRAIRAFEGLLAAAATVPALPAVARPAAAGLGRSSAAWSTPDGDSLALRAMLGEAPRAGAGEATARLSWASSVALTSSRGSVSPPSSSGVSSLPRIASAIRRKIPRRGGSSGIGAATAGASTISAGASGSTGVIGGAADRATRRTTGRAGSAATALRATFTGPVRAGGRSSSGAEVIGGGASSGDRATAGLVGVCAMLWSELAAGVRAMPGLDGVASASEDASGVCAIAGSAGVRAMLGLDDAAGAGVTLGRDGAASGAVAAVRAMAGPVEAGASADGTGARAMLGLAGAS
jgi:hypothetical protein